MKRKDINEALKSALATGGLPISGEWPAVQPSGTGTVRPYFEVVFVGQDSAAMDLKGAAEVETGIMTVSVIVDYDGTGEDAANDYADSIKTLFPAALRIPITGGLITIRQPPSIKGGYKDGPDWRVPVLIQYRAISQ